jgi:hypothetical protein
MAQISQPEALAAVVGGIGYPGDQSAAFGPIDQLDGGVVP